jgi:hypothetical protein
MGKENLVNRRFSDIIQNPPVMKSGLFKSVTTILRIM